MASVPSKVFTHIGTWNSSSCSNPTLRFLEAYTSKITSRDSSGPFHSWYAPSAVFFNGDGKIYQGGPVIWEWVAELFRPFKKLGEGPERVVRLLEKQVPLQLPGEARGASLKPGQIESGPMADLVMYEHVMVFYPKSKELQGNGEGISVRRMMEFVIGESEVEGQGTHGHQIWQGKVWWDRAVLGNELEKRKLAAEAT